MFNLPRQGCIPAKLALTMAAVVLLTANCGWGAAAELNLQVRHSTPEGGTLRAIASSGSTWVAAGDGGRILQSEDGRDWVPVESGTRATLHATTFAGGRFVAVGDHGTIRWSDDGLVWHAAANSGTADHLYSVAFGKGRFVAVGDYGVVLVSFDGEHWTEAPRFILTPLRAVTYGPGMFLAGGSNGVIVHSYYGDAWSNSFAGARGEVTGIASHANGFVAITEAGQPLGGFFDWRMAQAPALPADSARIFAIAIGTDTAIAVGERGTALIVDVPQAMGAHSPGEWGTRVPVPPSVNAFDFHAAAFVEDRFFIVGDNLTILQSAPVISGRLTNLSVRAGVGAGERTLIGGFAIRGRGPKRILVRAAGPSLASFAVTRPLPWPNLTVFDGHGTQLAANTGWGTSADVDKVRSAMKDAGAFAFAEGSADCAVVLSLLPGIYTAQIRAADSGTGVALLELYDLDRQSVQSRITNLSARAYIDKDGEPVIPGITTSGSSRTLLLRAVGPGLAAFGISLPLPDPRFRTIFPGLPPGIRWPGSPPSAGPWYDTWHAALDYAHAYSPDDIRETTARLGAFPLAEGSRDAAGLFGKGAGAMSIEVGDATGAAGIVLFEVYDSTGL
jgi:hypothetical protein